MINFRSYDRSQRMLLPPDLKEWVADDDLTHFIVKAVERIDMRAFHVSRTGFGKAQYHPRPYDFRPPKKRNTPPPKITAPWRQAMQEKLQTDEAKQKYRK